MQAAARQLLKNRAALATGALALAAAGLVSGTTPTVQTQQRQQQQRQQQRTFANAKVNDSDTPRCQPLPEDDASSLPALRLGRITKY